MNYQIILLKKKEYREDNTTKEKIVKFLIKVFINKNKDKETFLYDYKEYLLFLNCLVNSVEIKSYRLTDDMIDENICDLSEFGIKKGLKKVS